MAECPLVTVAVPVYNGDRTLCSAIDSIQAQTYTNLEILICDNASTDKTRELCQKYASTDPRVRYHRNAENIGQTKNFRRALELGRGEFFMWSCADDTRPITAIEHLIHPLIKNPQVVMAHGPVIAKGQNFAVEVSNEMDLSSSSAAKRIRAFTRSIRHNSMVHGLYRRTALKDLVFGAHYGQDYLFCLQVCLLGPVEYVPWPMIMFHERGTAPSIGAMGQELPFGWLNVLKMRGTRGKCLTVLFTGSKYLMGRRNIDFGHRVMAVAAHLTTFGVMYRRRLIMDAFSLLLWPLCGRPQWPGS